MPNPIMIIFEYHQVPAGEHLFQSNVSGLMQAGYKTYLDDEACGIDLNQKQALANHLVIEAQKIPDDSDDIWQKDIVTTRKKSIDLLVEHQFNYHAYDLPEQEIRMLLERNLDVLLFHPEGVAQGMNDLLSGKIPERQEAYERKVQFQNKEFAKQARNAKGEIICITGIYHAKHLQSYLRAQLPGQDILSFFPYQGPSFEPFEDKARNPKFNADVFPHGARLINMDADAEREQSKHIMLDDLITYTNMVKTLARIEQDLIQNDVPKDTLDAIQEELQTLKANSYTLTSLNNLDMYLFAMDAYLLKCAIEKKDLSYIKASYPDIQKSARALPKTEFKSKLISLIKEIIQKYQVEQKLVKEMPKASNHDSSFFAEKKAAEQMQDLHLQDAITLNK
ncbi:MAG: hypothetical protein JJT82_06275 [Legionellaceae bacterium]|nr:hypothetical protein [Legionellaceae bacterium]